VISSEWWSILLGKLAFQQMDERPSVARLVQEPGAHFALPFDVNDTAMLQFKRLRQGVGRSVAQV